MYDESVWYLDRKHTPLPYRTDTPSPKLHKNSAVQLTKSVPVLSTGTLPVLIMGTLPVLLTWTLPVLLLGTLPVLSSGTLPVLSTGTLPVYLVGTIPVLLTGTLLVLLTEPFQFCWWEPFQFCWRESFSRTFILFFKPKHQSIGSGHLWFVSALFQLHQLCFMLTVTDTWTDYIMLPINYLWFTLIPRLCFDNISLHYINSACMSKFYGQDKEVNPFSSLLITLSVQIAKGLFNWLASS